MRGLRKNIFNKISCKRQHSQGFRNNKIGINRQEGEKMNEKDLVLQDLYELLDTENNLTEIPSEGMLSNAFIFIDRRFRAEDFDDATEVTECLFMIMKGKIKRLKEKEGDST